MPAVASSFGKDSQLMLALIREFQPEIAVLYFQGIPHPTKHDFPLKIVQEWSLKCEMPLPFARDLIEKNGHVEVVELYRVGSNQAMYFPIEPEPDYVPDENTTCAIELLLSPVNSNPVSYDALFIGHRGDDIDPVYGAVPLQSDVLIEDGFRWVYPLKDWTEADIWEASALLKISQNEARYRKQDWAANNDYYPLCTQCLSKKEGSVFCHIEKREVPALGGQMNLEQRRKDWRSVFVNL